LLAHLQVKNFALIEDIEVELSDGLNVITGETGAGKSLFVDAMQVALGGRGSTEFVRTGAEEATVWALFDLPDSLHAQQILDDLGIEAPEATVLIEREIRRSGANRARINGRLASVATIAAFSKSMVELHGQHEQRGLISPNRQREILDSMGGPSLAAGLQAVESAVRRLRSIYERQREILGDSRERARRLDLLRYQRDEIDGAALDPHEEDELLDRRNVMANVQALRTGIGEAVTVLSEGDAGRVPMLEELGHLSASLGRLADMDPALGATQEVIHSAQLELEEAARALRRYLDCLDFDPQDRERVEQRLQLLTELKRKYGSSIQEVIAYGQEVVAEIARIESSEEEAERLGEEQLQAEREVAEAANALGAMRREAAESLRAGVESELADLHMENTRFAVHFERHEDPEGVPLGDGRFRVGLRGAEDVEFMISPNPGEPLMPLRRVASGGELARISLALESAAAAIESPPTLIFDEIDAGVGGRAGSAVARKLAGLARCHQVLCVTHLPQIASYADVHFYLAKHSSDERTVSTLTRLSAEQRVDEVARMLAGDIDREAAIAHARKMIAANSSDDSCTSSNTSSQG